MLGFFTRERFGRPQVLAGLLLFLFLAQCAWLMEKGGHSGILERSDMAGVVRAGLRQWNGGPIAGTPSHAGELSPLEPDFDQDNEYDPDRSPLWYLVASSAFALWPSAEAANRPISWIWLAAAPSLLVGLVLGASLWYVSRRLYGNAGGYIALALYCLSPGIFCNAALWSREPQLGAAWGAFGAVFTAIAVAHTLYAPREVVLWNWRRILLLGLSLALAIGSQFSLVILVPIVFAFMLYLAPEREGSASLIWAAACLVGVSLLFASYFFQAGVFWQGMKHASFWEFAGTALAMPGAYGETLARLGQLSPAVVFALPVVLVVYFAWPRARYFGNTAPLLVAPLFLFLALGNPHNPRLAFQLVAVPFLCLFVAGVLADLLETRRRNLVLACVWALLVTNAIWNFWQLARVGRG
jgi:hypothetical protein